MMTAPGRQASPKRLKLQFKFKVQPGEACPPATRPLHSLRELPICAICADPPDASARPVPPTSSSHASPTATSQPHRIQFGSHPCSTISCSTFTLNLHNITSFQLIQFKCTGVVLLAYQVHRLFYLLSLSRSPEKNKIKNGCAPSSGIKI